MSAADPSDVEQALGRKMTGTGFLSTELLQANCNDPDELRLPSKLVVMPAHQMVAVGFQSGELQLYSLGESQTEPVPSVGFMLKQGSPVNVLKQLEDWYPFDKDFERHEDDEKRSILYGACGDCDQFFMFYVIGRSVKLSWIKYQLPAQIKSKITDGIVCATMSKTVVATDLGRLFLFPAVVQHKRESNSHGVVFAEEHVEHQHIVKVAHEGGVNCVATNPLGTLILSGGRDGKIGLWKWGADNFLHQVGQLYLTNLPIQSALFTMPDDSEIVLSIDTYLMCLRVIRRTSQHYILEQNPNRHFKMTSGGGKIIDQQGIHFLPLSPSNFLVLRTSRSLELLGPGKDECRRVDQKPVTCLCVDLQIGRHNDQLMTGAAYLPQPGKPIIYFWTKSGYTGQKSLPA